MSEHNPLSREVLILNQNYEPLSVTGVKKAFIISYLGKAQVIETYEDLHLRTVDRCFPVPSVVRLKDYIRITRRSISPTRKNILKRDGYRCQYCGTKSGPMTVDHVIPRTMGGKDTWENLVCACVKCNTRKGKRSLKESSFALLRAPRKPHFFYLIHNILNIPHPTWRPYLFLDPL
jgi:5-methylcytosine-specific restriction endonuclease McrA